MAGIIGNMTAQARLRRGRKEVISNKSVYHLQPFSPGGFRPERDNKFLASSQNRINIERIVRHTEEQVRRTDRKFVRFFISLVNLNPGNIFSSLRLDRKPFKSWN